MTMYLITIEDEDGIWWSDPIGTDTREEAEKLSRWQDDTIPAGYKRVLWKCEMVKELEEE
jgi:hypothetical protein